MRRYINIVTLIALMLIPLHSYGKSHSSSSGNYIIDDAFKRKNHKIKRVSGNYEVFSIVKKAEGEFEITFKSEIKTGRFDTIFLNADHVYIAIEEGASFRISAEILADNGSRAEASQILVYLPSNDTHIPVWLLSRRANLKSLEGVKFIKMHAPSSDYLVF